MQNSQVNQYHQFSNKNKFNFKLKNKFICEFNFKISTNIKFSIEFFCLIVWIFKEMPYIYVVKAKHILKVMPVDNKNRLSNYVQYGTEC